MAENDGNDLPGAAAGATDKSPVYESIYDKYRTQDESDDTPSEEEPRTSAMGPEEPTEAGSVSDVVTFVAAEVRDEDVDALLGCPVWMPSQDVVDNFGCLGSREAKDAVCATLFYGVNWMRELINGFADNSDTEYRPKVLLR